MMAYVDSAIRFIVATLFSGLWQAPLFALAAWLVLRVRPNANATTRHSVLAAALFASLVLPPITAAVTRGAVSAPALVTASSTQTSSAAHGIGDTQIPKNITPYNPAKHGASVPSRTTPVENTPSPSLAVPSLVRMSLSLPHWSALVLVAIWFAGAAFVLLRLVISLGHLERLKRDALPLPVEYRAALTRWATASKGSRTVRLCTSDEIEIPIAVGLFDAMILVPTRLLEELEPHDIDSIVLHELAHLRRADDWVNAIERFTQAFLFFNPGILWLNAQLDLEREVACDDWVLQQNDALPYATCLAKVVETTVWPFRAMTAPGAFVTRRGMSIRIERLLAKQRDVRVHTSFGPAGAAVGMLAVLGLVAAFVSPSIAYSVSQAEHPSLAATSATPVKAVDTSGRFDSEQVAKSKAYAALLAREAHDRAAQLAAATAERQLAEQSAREAATIKALTDAQHRLPAGTSNAKRAPHASAYSSSASAYSGASAGDSADGSNDTAADSSSDSAASSDAGPQPDPRVRPDAHPSVHANPQPHAHAMAVSSYGITAGVAAEIRDAMKTAVAVSPALPEIPKVSVVKGSPDSPQLVADANSPDYIDELASVGYTKLSVDELVQMKAVGVSASFIRELQRQGCTHPSVSDLVQMRAIGVDPAFIGAMRRRYGDSLSIGDIVGMRAVGVTNDYIEQLSAAGFKDISADRVRSFRALGVTPAYVQSLSRAGYTNLSADQIQQLKALGVDRDFISHAASHGFHDLTIQQLINLKATGVL